MSHHPSVWVIITGDARRLDLMGLAVMTQLPFHLRYTLNRSQRLVTIVRTYWGVPWTLFVLVLFSFFCVESVVSARSLSGMGLAVFGGLALFVFLVYRGLFVGLIDVLLVPVRRMDIMVEENAAGILIGTKRWYLFLDGITDLRKYRDTWTIQHWNGSVLHIPAAATSGDQIGHLKAATQRGRTPEGFMAVVERGKRIEEIMRSERMR
jgi:hypothetical protein